MISEYQFNDLGVLRVNEIKYQNGIFSSELINPE